MAQLKSTSQIRNDGVIADRDEDRRQETDVSVQETPMTATTTDDAMSPETLEDQEVAQAYNSSMSLPFQAGEAQDVGPVSAVYTRREVYVTPGGDVTEQVTEYSTTTMQPGTGNTTTEDADRLLRLAQEQANYARQQLGFDPYFNAADGAPGYDQMNPSAGYGNQAFYTGGLDYGGHGQLSPMPGFAMSNPAISTDLTATAAYAGGGAEVGSHPPETRTTE
jgi:hypothetical protein